MSQACCMSVVCCMRACMLYVGCMYVACILHVCSGTHASCKDVAPRVAEHLAKHCPCSGECCMYVACMLYVCCMCVHVCCMRAASVLHVCRTCVVCMLPVRRIHVTCTRHCRTSSASAPSELQASSSATSAASAESNSPCESCADVDRSWSAVDHSRHVCPESEDRPCPDVDRSWSDVDESWPDVDLALPVVDRRGCPSEDRWLWAAKRRDRRRDVDPSRSDVDGS